MKTPLALVGLFAFGAVAHGQIQSITDDGTFTNHIGSLTGNLSYNVSQSHTYDGSQCSFHLAGDIRFQGTEPSQSGTFGGPQGAYFSVNTGINPTLLTSITMSWNGKEVNSGNVGGSANSTLISRGVLYENGFGGDIDLKDTFPERDGQGYWIEDVDLNNSDIILNPLTTYTVYLNVYPIYTVTNGSGASAPGYSLEYGGLWSPIFDGLTLSMNYQAVPEPGTMVLLGVPALLAWRRRRKSA